MILPGSFSKEWIDQFRKRKEFSKVNPPILEKMIRALSLVEGLRLSGMEFILKGGSSLILLLDQPGRFSVDIDILTTHPREELEETLDKVIKESHKLKKLPNGALFYWNQVLYEMSHKITRRGKPQPKETGLP